MRISVHSCLLDKDCRSHGVPGFTYLTIGKRTFRLNPLYTRSWHRTAFGESRWDWHVLQTWRRAPDPVIEVHRITSDEWQVLKDLRVRSLTESPDALYGNLSIERDLNEGWWREEIESYPWVVATRGMRPIGLARLNQADDGAHVESLWVAPHARRQGAARLLVAEVEKIAIRQGTRQLYGWILTGNDIAQRVIGRLGFAHTIVRQTIEINGRATAEDRYRKTLGT